MIDFMYFVIVLFFVVLFSSFIIKEFYVGILSSMGLILTGIYVINSGLGGYTDFLTETIGIICIAVGAYVLLRGNIEELGEEI